MAADRAGLDVRAEVVAELLRPSHLRWLEYRRRGEGNDLRNDAIVRALAKSIVWTSFGSRTHFVRRVAAQLRRAVWIDRLRKFYGERRALEFLRDLATLETERDPDGGES